MTHTALDPAEYAALERLLKLALNDSAAARCAADFLLAWYNAAEYGDEPAARALLAGGAAVDSKTNGGATPAQLALLRRDPQAQPIVCLLTFWAADVEAALVERCAAAEAEVDALRHQLDDKQREKNWSRMC
jgi:hypothetical protein